MREIVINRDVSYKLTIDEERFTLARYENWADSKPAEVYSTADALIEGFGAMNYFTALDLLGKADKALPKRQASRLRKFYNILGKAKNSRQALLCKAEAAITARLAEGKAGATDMRAATTRYVRALRDLEAAVAAIA